MAEEEDGVRGHQLLSLLPEEAREDKELQDKSKKDLLG